MGTVRKNKCSQQHMCTRPIYLAYSSPFEWSLLYCIACNEWQLNWSPQHATYTTHTIHKMKSGKGQTKKVSLVLERTTAAIDLLSTQFDYLYVFWTRLLIRHPFSILRCACNFQLLHFCPENDFEKVFFYIHSVAIVKTVDKFFFCSVVLCLPLDIYSFEQIKLRCVYLRAIILRLTNWNGNWLTLN